MAAHGGNWRGADFHEHVFREIFVEMIPGKCVRSVRRWAFDPTIPSDISRAPVLQSMSCCV